MSEAGDLKTEHPFSQRTDKADASGHYLSNAQKVYIKELYKFCGKFPNIEVESYSAPRGLSFLWNRIIKKSASDHILILNEDIRVKADFRPFMEQSGIIDSEIPTINSSLEPGGYSLLNIRHLLEKWETSDNYFDSAVEVIGRKMRYWKLRKNGN